MKPKFNYRIIIPATTEELEKYYNLRYEILRKRWGQEESTTRDEFEAESLHVLALDENENAIATGRLQFNKDGIGQIRSMAVADEFQDKGLGSEVLKFLEEEAKKRNIKSLVLDARDNAINFYLKNGYALEGRSYVLFDVIPHFKMSKKIS
jgi:predicted GNAT family N-acyltransferase